MTVATSAQQHLVDLSLMSNQDYLAYQRDLDDELTEYYLRGLTPPGMTDPEPKGLRFHHE